jgi:hypothetical protein
MLLDVTWRTQHETKVSFTASGERRQEGGREDTVFLRPKEFFVPPFPRIAAGWLTHHMLDSHHAPEILVEIGP